MERMTDTQLETQHSQRFYAWYRDYVDHLDDRQRMAMGDKLVMHSRGPIVSAVQYNRYVVNEKLFRTISHDAGKKSQNNGVCVPTVDGETYYRKLIHIIEVEYYDQTKYVLFKCDWADNTRDKGWKLDKHGLMLVNFKNLVHRGDQVTDEPYVLTSQVEQFFYVEDGRDPDWACAVRTKPRNVYDVGQGQGPNNEQPNYHESVPLQLDHNHHYDPQEEDIDYIRFDLPPIEATWLINSRGLASKVRNATCSPAYQIKDCGANRECPNCHFCIDNSDVSPEWPGLPIGVKFDPSDAELLEHLAAKCGAGNSRPHLFIDEFIPTLEGDQGICYTHPENLPGAKKDGSSVHFFHRTINAYASGQRKRRKIHSQHSLIKEHVRWHKTGKTKPVVENGVPKGCKKIMVLYKSSKKGSKPDKSNWVMHQYHLGTEEEEKEGEFVVSKVFYQQPKQTDNNDSSLLVEDSDIMTLRASPRTPKANPPNPPRPGKSVPSDDVADNNIIPSSAQKAEFVSEASRASSPAWLAGESQAVENCDLNCLDDSLLCKEIFDSCASLSHWGLNDISYTNFVSNKNEVTINNNASSGIPELENIELDTPPDFQLGDLQFGSQDSILSWIDRL